MNPTRSIPVACDLPEDEQKRCATAYKSGLFSHVREVREGAAGYSLRFSWDPERIRELGEFLALDSACCSFLDHRVEIPHGKRFIWLHLSGPDDAQELLRSEIQHLLPRRVALSEHRSRDSANRFGWGTLGVSGVGLLAVLCCAAPALFVAALATASAWFVDSWLALFVAAGIGLSAWLVFRRRGRNAISRKASCCAGRDFDAVP